MFDVFVIIAGRMCGVTETNSYIRLHNYSNVYMIASAQRIGAFPCINLSTNAFIIFSSILLIFS